MCQSCKTTGVADTTWVSQAPEPRAHGVLHGAVSVQRSSQGARVAGHGQGSRKARLPGRLSAGRGDAGGAPPVGRADAPMGMSRRWGTAVPPADTDRGNRVPGTLSGACGRRPGCWGCCSLSQRGNEIWGPWSPRHPGCCPDGLGETRLPVPPPVPSTGTGRRASIALPAPRGPGPPSRPPAGLKAGPRGDLGGLIPWTR